MKVTKMKRGYIIRLSDSEYDLLSNTIKHEALGSSVFIDEDWGHLPPAQQRICREIVNGTRDWLVVTEDRRN